METPLRYVDSEGALEIEMERIVSSGIREIAFDLEGEYNLHRYGMHLCLVQLFDGQQCVLVDTVKIKRPDALDLLFRSPVEKVMYSPGNDLMLLDHLFGFHPSPVCDLQSAAKLLGHEKLSLATVTREELGVELRKSKTRQRANWNARPLRRALVEYAMDDVTYLLELKKVLLGKLAQRKLLEEFGRINRQFEAVRYAPARNPYMNIKSARTLNRAQRVYLKYFYYARDEIAKTIDMCPNSVISNEAIIRMAKTAPLPGDGWRAFMEMGRRAAPYAGRMVAAKESADTAAGEDAAKA
jgi:ribonuclease D